MLITCVKGVCRTVKNCSLRYHNIYYNTLQGCYNADNDANVNYIRFHGLVLITSLCCKDLMQINVFGTWHMAFSIIYFYGVIKRTFIQYQTSGTSHLDSAQNFSHLLPEKGVGKVSLIFEI